MRPTAAQLSGRNSARSSRFAKSMASTIATSDGRPDPLNRFATIGPVLPEAARRPTPKGGEPTDPHCGPPSPKLRPAPVIDLAGLIQRKFRLDGHSPAPPASTASPPL